MGDRAGAAGGSRTAATVEGRSCRGLEEAGRPGGGAPGRRSGACRPCRRAAGTVRRGRVVLKQDRLRKLKVNAKESGEMVMVIVRIKINVVILL